MQHFQNNVANNVVINLQRVSKLRKERYDVASGVAFMFVTSKST